MADSQDIWAALKKDLVDDPNASFEINSTVPHGIPTGQPELDLCISRDGIPVGRIVEFFGFERSGKTTAALHIAAQCQKRGGMVLFIDTEDTFEMDRAVECGCVDNDLLKPVSAESIDAIFRTIDKFCDGIEGNWTKDAMIIVDSVTAVECEFNLANEIGTIPRPAEDARTLRSGLRRVGSRLARLNIPCIFINHAIEDPNAMFGKKSKASGGHAIKFASSVRVEFTHLGEVKDATKKGKEPKDRFGQKIKVSVVKVKGAHLVRTEFNTELLNEEGFHFADQLRSAATKIGLITQTGQGSGTRYNTINLETHEVENSFTKAEFNEWVRHCGKDECYRWFYNNAQQLKAIVPWGESRLDG
jgi:recombination protein RecA